MRTTIRIKDELYRDVKEQAAREGRTVGEVIEDALLARHQAPMPDEPVEPLTTFGTGGVQAGVDLSDNSALRQFMDADTPVDALR